jgi:ribosomal protein S18 acetylase RimI-like enzyme
MSVAERSISLIQRGTWPEPVRFRRGWARAEARRWNDVVPDASLRLVRGGSSFLEQCATRLNELGAPGVYSPPLLPTSRRPWEAAGFVEFLPLAFMRLDIAGPLSSPDHLVVTTPDPPMDELLDIDRAAFDEFWRFDRFGMAEAIAATGKARTLLVRGPEGRAVAFAVVGLGHAIAYLQRLAVHPDWQCERMGRSLVRAGVRLAESAGSSAIVLNTQVDNTAAIALYESEGFVSLDETLAVLRRD